MASPVTAERITGGTYILRWHRGGIGVNRHEVLASARLGGVRYHLPYVDQVPEDVAEEAAHAWTLMLAGLWGDVLAMATHRWAWRWLSLRRELVPVAAREVPVADLIDQSAIHVRLPGDGPHALKQADSGQVGRRYWTVCGRLLYARQGAVLTERDVECVDCRHLAGRRPS